MTRSSLAASIRQSIKRLPANHYGIARAQSTLDLLESEVPMTPRAMMSAIQNADWYTEYLERKQENNHAK